MKLSLLCAQTASRGRCLCWYMEVALTIEDSYHWYNILSQGPVVVSFPCFSVARSLLLSPCVSLPPMYLELWNIFRVYLHYRVR